MRVQKIEYGKHNQCYAIAQDEYLQNRNEKAFQKMFLVAYEYFHNALVCYAQRHGIYFWSSDFIDTLAEDCTTWILEMYLRRPSFKIQKLTSYGHFSLLKNIAKDKNWERNVELRGEWQI